MHTTATRLARHLALGVALAGGSLAGVAAGVGVAGAPPAGAAASGTVIAVTNGPFGPMLAVGSGKFAGYTAYLITSDTASSYGCTTKVLKLIFGPSACTGPPGDKLAEWPALTTAGAPVAGPEAKASLLGTVSRPGIGTQVTYAGHPLYLFDSGPGQLSGEGWDEPTLPPWHGVWYAVNPSGAPVAWPQMLGTTTIGHKTVLAADMLTGAGWERFPLYSFSRDGAHASACTGACAVAWPPLLTSGTPGVGGALSARTLGVIMRPDGTDQVTDAGHPLYLFAYEGIAPTATGLAATGNGNGVHAFGGVFQLAGP